MTHCSQQPITINYVIKKTNPHRRHCLSVPESFQYDYILITNFFTQEPFKRIKIDIRFKNTIF